jgi:hypothetical protein
MIPEERQAFFEREGYWPTTFVQVKFSPKAVAKQAAQRLQLSLQSRFLRGWKAPVHWTVPPAFENPGLMYEELGHEEYCQQVQEYYSALGRISYEKASREHTRWAIRQILRTFETAVRGFRGQSVGRKGSIFARSSGQQKFGSGPRATYQDILTMPEDLARDGRLVWNLESYLRAYAVCPEDLPMAERLAKARLSRIWGVKL